MSQATSTLQWFKVTPPAAECGTKQRFCKTISRSLFILNGAPKGAALFRSNEEGVNHVFYFSPGAVAIARGLIQHFAGEPCDVPKADAETPKLLVGCADEGGLLLKRADKITSSRKRRLYGILSRDTD